MKNVKYIWVSCKEATMLCTKQTETSLTFRERVALKIHLFICKPCLYFSKQIKYLHKSLKGLAENDKISFTEPKKKQLREKINEML